MRLDDALRAIAEPLDAPNVILVDPGTPPRHLAAAAAAVTRGRLGLRDERTDARTVGSMKNHNPPHLTIYEHCRWTFKLPALDERRLAALLDVGGNLVYDVLPEDDPDERPMALLSLNLSHIRQLALVPDERVAGWGCSLADLVRDEIPEALSDLPSGPPFGSPYIPYPDDFDPDMNRRHRPFTFLMRMSRAALDHVVTHRTLSRDTRSQRAIDEHDRSIGFVWPPQGPPEAFGGDWGDDYQSLRADGWHYQDARYALPMAAATIVMATAPMKAWRDFVWKRGQGRTMHETRFVAWQVYDWIRSVDADLLDGVEPPDTDDLGRWGAMLPVGPS